MKQYRVVGFDAEDEPLFEVSVEAPNQAIARIMVLAQICRNFATAPLADRTDKLVIHSNLKGGNSTAMSGAPVGNSFLFLRYHETI